MYSSMTAKHNTLTFLELLSTNGLWQILFMIWIPALILFICIVYILYKTRYRNKH